MLEFQFTPPSRSDVLHASKKLWFRTVLECVSTVKSSP